MTAPAAGGDVARERIEIVRAAVEALNRGDWDAALEHIAPDFEYDLTRTISPLRGVYRRDQMRAVVEEFLGPWESARYEADDLIAAGEHVVMPFTTRFHGRDGIEVEARATWVWTFRGRAVIRLRLFQDRDEALAAAGLS
jgi:ketosteroid isomerase-like protein